MKHRTLKISSKAAALLTVVVLLSGSVLTTPASVRAAPGDITRVSVDSTGAQANNASKRPSISGDGRFIAFESDASNLVVGDANASTDIFVRDRQTGETTRVSVGIGGAEANEGSGGAAISGDGRFVAFVSDASNLVANDTNNTTDVFVRDRQLGTTIRISVSSSGEQANELSDFPLAISNDGRFVAFSSDASNFVANDTNNSTDVFVHDNQTGNTERISIATDGTQANGTSYYPSISANGQFVTFTSNGNNLVIGDVNNSADVFVRDRSNNTTTRVSVNSSGEQADKGGDSPAISGDGRFVVFLSASNNLAPGVEIVGKKLVYVRDRQLSQTTLASVYSNGTDMTVGLLDQPTISSNGRYVAFSFYDKSDNNGIMNIWVRDLQLGESVLVKNGNASSFGAKISSDGRIVTFWSLASGLVVGDTNEAADAFAYETNFTTPDVTSPSVVSSTPLCATGCPVPTPAIVSFRAVFSEPVSGVTTDDFALTTGGAVTGAFIVDISGSNNEYTVNVNTGTGDGTLRLDVNDNDSIVDAALNPLGGVGAGNGNFTAGGLYVIDKTIPFVTAILRTDANPTVADTVHFTVTFSETVNGVDLSDFAAITTGGIAGATVTEVIGSNTTYTVTVATGTGDGTLQLNLFDNDSIVDQTSNPLGGAGSGNGNFTAGETYLINRNAPIVTSILRADTNPTTASIVRFTVNFSETVNGVDTGDFTLATSGNITGASIAEVNGMGGAYTVAVNTGTGAGNIRLNLVDNDSITDLFGLALGGAGAGNGDFVNGEEYTINKTTFNVITASFSSNGTNDGWVLESSEDSNQGSAKDANSVIFRLGDNAQDRQYRTILHFPTYYLPDNAVVTEVILMIKNQGVIGTNPFSTHQNITVDLRYGVFGSFGPWGIDALQDSDFQNPASVYSVGTITNSNNNGWYWTTLNSTANSYINLTGVTQFRLAFQLDDNDDLSDDFLTFYSGNHNIIPERPHLIIKYYIPK